MYLFFCTFVAVSNEMDGQKGKYQAMSDGELTAAVRGGDDRAYDAVFLRWYPQVRRFLFMLVKENALAEDLAQGVFMKLWLFRARLNPAQSLKNYLMVLARNAALDFFRSKYHTLQTDQSFPPDPAASERAEQKAEYTETSIRIRQAVEEMPVLRREVFKMSRFEQLSNKEIAVRLGLSVRTVEKHIQLALKDLRTFLS